MSEGIPYHALPYFGIFSSYFLLILALGGLIVQSLLSSPALKANGGKSISKAKAGAFVLLALASFAHTWFYMFKYMSWSFTNYESSLPLSHTASLTLTVRLASWLSNTSLFEEAWAAVCFGPLNWWWSEQLCLFTGGAWTVFLAVEGRRHNIKHLWAYMLLGQVVAISVASSLFYLALVLAPPPPPSASRHTLASAKLWAPVLLSLATIALSPHTTEETFLPNLLVMHALLIVPLIGSSPLSLPSQKCPYTIRTSTLYLLIFALSLPLRLLTTQRALASLPPSPTPSPATYTLLAAAWTTLHTHPAQSSIGWDVIWTSASFIAWVAARPEGTEQAGKLMEVPYLILATPVASVGVTAPYILRPRGEVEDASSSPADVKRE